MSELPSIDRLSELREKYGAPRHGDYVNTTMHRSELLSLLDCAIVLRRLEGAGPASIGTTFDGRGWRVCIAERASDATTLLAALVRALDQAERRT